MFSLYLPAFKSCVGYDGTGNEWGEDYSRYLNPEGVDMTSVSCAFSLMIFWVLYMLGQVNL